MRLLFTTDWHTDASTGGLSRRLDVEAHVREHTLAIERHGVDVVFFLGDAYDPGSLREGSYASFLIRAIVDMTLAARVGSLSITGNHDVIDSSEPESVLSPLAEAGALFNCGTAAQVMRVAHMPIHEEFVDRERTQHVHVLALPYVSRLVWASERYAAALDNAVSSICVRRKEGQPLVVVGHLSIPGVVPGSEEEMPRGREIPFPVDLVKSLYPTLVVNGHYHEPQTVYVDGLEIHIPGAPARFTFGETSGERGYLVAEV